MTTTPLPPTKHDHPDVHTMIWTQSELVWIQNRDAQWQAYATQARADLEAENQRLREKLAALRKEALEPPSNKTHRCIKCLHAYRPDNGDSEDCPSCGHNGTALEKQHD